MSSSAVPISDTSAETPGPGLSAPAPSRITSIDALRGLVVFTMIFVNDLAGAPSRIVPAWMRHYHGRSGMTFVDLVFPAFLFLVGMSIPFALGSRLDKGRSLPATLGHVLTRTLSLLVIGVLMVNESPDTDAMGWSATVWTVLMYSCAILGFNFIKPRGARQAAWRWGALALRVLGLSALLVLAFAFRGQKDHRIISLSPFFINVEWYGILGLIGWAYLVGAIGFLAFRGNRAALVACMALLFCMYPAERAGFFDGFWPARFVGFGGTLGSQAAITMGGVLLASILTASDLATPRARARFTLLFAGACSIGAMLLTPVYGVSKNAATPAWCLWACAISATLWLGFYFLADVWPRQGAGNPVRWLALAGSNVLLAYLLSEMLPSLLDLIGAGDWYYRLCTPNLACAVARSAGCGVVLLMISTLLNRLGFRLRL